MSTTSVRACSRSRVAPRNEARASSIREDDGPYAQDALDRVLELCRVSASRTAASHRTGSGRHRTSRSARVLTGRLQRARDGLLGEVLRAIVSWPSLTILISRTRSVLWWSPDVADQQADRVVPQSIAASACADQACDERIASPYSEWRGSRSDPGAPPLVLVDQTLAGTRARRVRPTRLDRDGRRLAAVSSWVSIIVASSNGLSPDSVRSSCSRSRVVRRARGSTGRRTTRWKGSTRA